MRYLAGRSITLSHTFLDDETELTPAAVTVTVTRVGATVATISGSATLTGTVYTFSAGMLSQGVYTVEWDGVTAVDTETVEVVGGYLFTIPALRAIDDALTAARYPADEVKLARDVVESEFERITGRSFTPRTGYLALAWIPAEGDLLPYRDVVSVTAIGGTSDGTTLDIERIGHYSYVPELPTDPVTGEVDITGLEVAYGFSGAPDGIGKAAKVYARWLLLEDRSSIPDRATSFQPAEGGTYTLATPGKGGAETGIPAVDAVLGRYWDRIIDSVGLA